MIHNYSKCNPISWILYSNARKQRPKCDDYDKVWKKGLWRRYEDETRFMLLRRSIAQLRRPGTKPSPEKSDKYHNRWTLGSSALPLVKVLPSRFLCYGCLVLISCDAEEWVNYLIYSLVSRIQLKVNRNRWI